MYLAIAGALVIIYVIIKPLGDGLLDTSRWAAKVLAPPAIDDPALMGQLIRMSQAAMMEGWLSNVPFYNMFVAIAAVILGFIHSWWGGLLVIFGALILGALTTELFGRSLCHYLAFIHHKMVNRAADYKARNDAERAAACEVYSKDLERLMLIYQGSGVRPPTQRQLKDVPYGDVHYWLNHAPAR
jgi:hypothetical protein